MLITNRAHVVSTFDSFASGDSNQIVHTIVSICLEISSDRHTCRTSALFFPLSRLNQHFQRRQSTTLNNARLGANAYSFHRIAESLMPIKREIQLNVIESDEGEWQSERARNVSTPTQQGSDAVILIETNVSDQLKHVPIDFCCADGVANDNLHIRHKAFTRTFLRSFQRRRGTSSVFSAVAYKHTLNIILCVNFN